MYAIDPDTQEEILFAYVNYGEEAEYINNSITEKKELYYDLIITVDNAESVNIIIDSNTVYVTEKEFIIANSVITAVKTIPHKTTIDGEEQDTVINNGYEVILPDGLQYQVRQ